MVTAICIRCGSTKRAPYVTCSSCGFEPQGDDDLVKSVYLSERRFEADVARRRYASELAETAASLRAGGSVSYVPSELERLKEQLHVVRGVTPGMAWGVLGRFFLPALLFIAALLALAWLVRTMRSQ